jgi:hypothetical protein
MLVVCLASLRAVAEEPTEKSADEETAPDEENLLAPPPKTPPPTAQPKTEPPPIAAAPTEAVEPAAVPGAWHTGVNGYFRAPMALGLSQRPGPDNLSGPSSTQVSYGPNRTIDSNYYSFAYTRLQEQDWAEVFVHAKKAHVDAAVGWMGYWFQSVGFRNYDAAWAPGVAYVALDTDFGEGEQKSNIMFTAGAWWPSFGYFEKYDTYTLGRFRQLGLQLKLTVPLNPDLTVTGTAGFGTGRDGSFNPGAPPMYGSTVGADLLAYGHLKVSYQKLADLGFHINTEWTADPNLWQQMMMTPKSYDVASTAHLSVVGLEANVRVPHWGHLWLSPSFLSVRNGWALDSAGTEVMHSLGGAGIAGNYMAFNNSLTDSTGSGSMTNFGFLYENTLSNVLGLPPGTLTEWTFSVFGLLADASLNLPVNPPGTPASMVTQSTIEQFKYGFDLAVQPLTWLGFMGRFDFVNYNVGHGGYVFDTITGRAIVSSHFLSSERIYIQYSRYKYGDKMVLAGAWPWDGQPLVAGSINTQSGPYANMTPDENVFKVQAEVAF